jgi:hypothetical protein
MSVLPAETRPASSRPFSFRDHAAFALVLAVAAPLMFAFVWQHGLASMGDDSFSYLTLARYFAPGPSLVDAWAAQHAHLPPLFPLALLLGGGSSDLLVAHLLVAGFAVLALALVYAFATRLLGRPWLAALAVAAFVLTPTAWISIKGILSESLYLLFSMAALCLHAARIDRPRPGARDLLAFGVLLACAYLTRAAGAALIAAYAVHVLYRGAIGRERPWGPLLLPAAPVCAAAAAWMLLRPGEGGGYRDVVVYTLESWLDRGLSQAPYAARLFLEGWVASFHAETWTTPLPRAVFTIVLALGIAGAARRAWRNRLDGWYVLLSLALTFFWMYPQDAARRLLYPVVPLLLLHAALFVAFLGRRIAPAYRQWIFLGAAALPLAVCVPAAVLLFQKALQREPVAGTTYAYADITEYFLHVNEAQARAVAGASLATFAGFEGVAATTPADAKVMWVRPEYVALLAGREAVAYENAWDGLRLAREIARSGTRYVIFAEVFKVDVNLTMRHPREVLADVPGYSREILVIANPPTRRREFVLYEIDPARLAAFIAGREGGERR